jgi:hypothetical protein
MHRVSQYFKRKRGKDFAKYYYDNQFKKDEMGRECSMYERHYYLAEFALINLMRNL